jgi:cytochrome c biogenesis protein CcmG/thiol:disulfide interchange protein DsbE
MAELDHIKTLNRRSRLVEWHFTHTFVKKIFTMTITRIFLLALAIACCSGVYGQKQIPSAHLKTLDGKTVDIKDYTRKGKLTVISFWATWCGPCKKELDAIADYYPDWQKDYNVELIAVTIDDTRALPKVGPMVQSKNWPFLILSDANQQLKNALNFQSIPQTFLIDKTGNIIYSHSGYVPGDELELENKIKAAAK